MIINTYDDAVKFFRENLMLEVTKDKHGEIQIIEDGEESMRFTSSVLFIDYAREVRDLIQFV